MSILALLEHISLKIARLVSSRLLLLLFLFSPRVH